MNELELKRQIFDLFDSARVLFNDYYNGKNNYTETDLLEISNLIRKIETINIPSIKEEVAGGIENYED